MKWTSSSWESVKQNFQRRLWVGVLGITILVIQASFAQAQPVVGRCFNQAAGVSFAMLPDYRMYQENMPANTAFAMRDPSGQTFIRIPAANPFLEAYFAAWDGTLLLMNQMGVFPIGVCQFVPGFMPQNPGSSLELPPMANWGVRVGAEPMSPMAIPEPIARPQQRYTPPMLTTPTKAQSCYQSTNGDQDEFADCMVRAMTGRRERAVYDCARNSQDNVRASFCIAGALGGANERKAANQLSNCHDKYGTEYRKYALCMAGQNTGGEAAKILSCVEQQAQQGDVNMLGTAICYGGQSLQLNPELQIAVQCAITTGGQPMAFAGCAGGQLTSREIQKCLDEGIGGDSGCFGPNNEVIKALRLIGLNIEFSQSNDIVRNWNNAVNDLQHGPGDNNDAVRAVATVANDIANGPGKNNDIVQAVDNVVPGFADLF